MKVDKNASALDILMKIIELQSILQSLAWEADSLKNAGNLPDAIAAYEKLIEQCELEKTLIERHRELDSKSIMSWSPQVMLNSMGTLADLLESQGKKKEAEEIRRKNSEISGAYQNKSDQMENQRQLAESLLGQGRFGEALTMFNEVRDYFIKNSNPLRLANVTSNLAEVLEWLGDEERSLAYVNEALALLEPERAKAPDPGGGLKALERTVVLNKISAQLLQTAGRCYKLAGNYDLAWNMFEKVRPLIPPQVLIGIDFQFVTLMILKKDFANGLIQIEKLEPQWKGLIRHKLGVLLGWKAECLLGLGRLNEALETITEGIADHSRFYDPDSFWQSWWRKARIHLALSQKKEALEACRQSIEVISLLRKGSLGYRLDNLYLKNKMPALEEGIELACTMGMASLCCQFMEVVKSRTLSSIFSSGKNSKTLESGLEKEIWTVTEKLDILEFKSFSLDWNEQSRQEHQALLVERGNLLEKMRFTDDRWRSLSESPAFDLNGIQSAMKDRDQAILTLFLRDTTIYTVLIDGKSCQVNKIKVKDEGLNRIVAYERNLSVKNPDASLFDFSLSAGIEASDLIPSDFLDQALKAKSVIIVPHRLLHLLPWSGMLYRGKRLFEYCPIGITPNVTCITNLVYPPKRDNKAAMIGAPDYDPTLGLAPLLMSVAELELVKTIYDDGAGVIDIPRTGKSATVENFWKLAGHKDSNNQILHVSSHGKIQKGDPFSAALIFANGKVDATRLTLSRMKYCEVVLSACSTGYRPEKAGDIELLGDDIISLPGSLLEGGVRAVTVSIPPARDDATLSFISLYHGSRAAGATPLTALREAQTTMLTDNAYPPYLWVGFTIYGVI